MSDVTTKFPWDQTPKESPEAYRAFKSYLLADFPRKLSKAAEAEKKSVQQMKTWSTKNKWLERARLYDTYYNREQIAQINDAVADSLANARAELLKQEYEDYKSMRDAWQVLFDEAVDDKELSALGFAKLVSTRLSIDDFGRRTLKLPLTYSAKEQIEEDEDDDEPLVLSDNGPVYRLKDTNGETEV